jgi:5,10-methylene-tetrahydrofolate dehydrogenase/methenyl tetrahydrofolate cyclohydrolase
MQQRFRGSISRARRALICAGTTVALAATMTVAAAFTSPAAQAATPSYKVAVVGDSWISGEGLGNYLSGTDTATNECHRSNQGLDPAGHHAGALPDDRAARQ